MEERDESNEEKSFLRSSFTSCGWLEKRVRTKFSRKENFHVIKEFRHEKGKLFSPKQEAFWFTEGEILGGYILVDEN